jgi:amino acid adenylation domain-containing protein/non-ribosomal peptide synthase protein (TIGR01720 family)
VTDGGFDQLLEEVKQTVLEAYEHQIYPFDKLVDDLDIPRNLSHSPLFDVLIVLQNFDELNKSKASFPEIKVSEYATDRVTSKFDLTFNFSESENGLLLTIEYNTDLFGESTIQRMGRHFEQLSKSVLENEKTFISQLEYLTLDETNKLLSEFNFTSSSFCSDKTLPQLFENKVKETPDKVAILFNGKSFTFKEIDEKSSKLATYLITRYNIENDQLIPLIADRSEWMIIAILGILKSGAAYVPIDPNYPIERINYILQDASAKVVITDKERTLSNICPSICLETDWKEIVEAPALELDDRVSPSNLAYVIYTSGSTGRPKGVLIEHHGVVNRIEWMWKHYNFSTKDIIFQKTTYTFDVSVWEIFLPLCYGATQVICSKEVIYNPSDIIDHIHQYSITTLHFVPSMLSMFLEEVNESNQFKLQSLRHVMASGEALSPELVKKFYSKLCVPLQNLYGPTEASVDVSYYETKQTDKIVPIGKPISNIKLYVLNDNLSLVHIGGIGEICISGVGLARGYQKLPDQTREKFVDHPFEQETKLYRTGDLGRWLEGGNIEFLGRKDHQVKIRGFRIELGEIENCLLQYPGIKECVAVSTKDATGAEQLIAYYTAEKEFDEISSREHLKRHLPEYMIPHLLIRLDLIPLTSSGKADRKNLPMPETIFAPLKDQEVNAPSSKMEEVLMEIWSQVLGKEIKSVSSNFFHIGGDSIKAIQISSRLYKTGFKIEIRDIFRYPTIVELAHAAKPITRIADQSPVEGEIPLTPIQIDFFAKYKSDIHHFNQAIMLFSENGFDENALKKSFEKIQQHHDALRITFEISSEVTKAINNKINHPPLSIEIFDLKDVDNDKKCLEDKCNEIQGSFNLEQGPLFKVALYKLKDGDRLFMVAHHLIMDGVSWRILFEDLQTLNKQYNEDQPLQLPLKTDSFKRWSEKLIEYSRSNEFFNEIEYWTKIELQDIPQISHHNTEMINGHLSTISFVLSKKDTTDLVTKVNEVYNTNINDTLLTSLGLSIKQLFGLEKVLIMLEGHGREEIIKDIDVTRTIGWFTSLYPVVLDFAIADNISRQIKEVKEYLRKVPSNGIGYGIWKYISGKSELEKNKGFKPQILFNYLGHIEAETSNQAFAIAKESTGRSKGTMALSPYDWEIEGHIINDSLKISLRYKENHFKSEILKAFMNCYEENLLEVIKHCLNQEKHEITPSDLTLNDLTFEEIEKLESLFN